MTDDDEFERFIDPGANRHEHTLTVLEDGSSFITEHQVDPGFTLLSGCHMFKIAHRAFEWRRPDAGERARLGHAPAPGVYRITVGDDGNLHVFGRLNPQPEAGF